MKIDDLKIIAPSVFDQQFNESEMLGAITWLWMHSPSHRNAPLHTLPAVMLPAIKNRQFIFISRKGKPIFYLSFGWLNEKSEKRYLTEAFVMMKPEDWNSGKRLWMFDCIAPFGDFKKIHALFLRQWGENFVWRMLAHRVDERAVRVIERRGRNISKKDAQQWFAENPLAVAITDL